MGDTGHDSRPRRWSYSSWPNTLPRDWTRHERRAALARAVRERREYVLPARFDDTALPGLVPDMVTVDLRGRTPDQFAGLIAAKLADLGISAPGPAGGLAPVAQRYLDGLPGALGARLAEINRPGLAALTGHLNSGRVVAVSGAETSARPGA